MLIYAKLKFLLQLLSFFTKAHRALRQSSRFKNNLRTTATNQAAFVRQRHELTTSANISWIPMCGGIYQRLSLWRDFSNSVSYSVHTGAPAFEPKSLASMHAIVKITYPGLPHAYEIQDILVVVVWFLSDEGRFIKRVGGAPREEWLGS